MSEKRRDSKGRVLRNGESQRPDGKYMFRYTDSTGERHTVYSWKLVSTDKLKEGQRNSQALRGIEKRILKDLDDSIKTQELNEVVVEAQMQQTSATSSTYIPNKKQKSSAQNAVDLLQQLAIPQITINLVDNAVTTISGQNVAIYINYLPASSQEIEGLLSADVRRVEYLDFPTDPRFNGSEHVVNFIMQRYEYGGYTKLTINENFLVGLSNRASVYSKFAYKRMCYDLYAGTSNHDNKHGGTSYIGKYTIQDKDGVAQDITRSEILTMHISSTTNSR